MPFLRPLPMVKVAVVGLKDDRETILSALHDLGAVQVEPVSKEALQVFDPERGSQLSRTVGDELLRIRALRSALPRQPGSAPRVFRDLTDILAEAHAVPIDAEVADLVREEDRLTTRAKELEEEVQLLSKFDFYPDRLEYLQAGSILAFFGEAKEPVYRELAGAIPELSDADFLTHAAGKEVRFLLAVRREQADAVARLAQQKGVRLFPVPRRTGTVAESLAPVKAELAQVGTRRAEIRSELARLATIWYARVAAVEEALSIENRKLEAWSRLGTSASSFTLEGWIARRDRADLEATLQNVTAGRSVLYDVPTKEEPPTVMWNPAGIRKYEFFIRFYALPLSSEWDPTWVFAIAFPIFFGLMIGDLGYGLVILLVSLWMIQGFPGGRYLPGSIKGFVKLIMPPSAMRSLAFTLVPGALIGMSLGVVFDSFFGYALYAGPPIYDPIAKLSQLLLIAGYIGLTMVVLGFTLGALKEYFHHHYRGALGKVGGVAFALGIATIGLGLLRNQHYLPPDWNAFFALAWVSLGLGVVFIVVGEGAQGVMGLVEVISHILSYTRIVGILLASVILATVINQSADGLFHSGVVGAIFGIVVLVAGQTFNIILAVFEPGIQGARLIFVENFSKFYQGNGRGFRPFGSAREHTASAYTEAMGTRGVAGRVR